MALFGRRGRKTEDQDGTQDQRDSSVERISGDLDDIDDLAFHLGGSDGPYDEAEAPDDEHPRLDLGSVRVPVPNGAQLQVEMDPTGPVRAVHIVTQEGQLTVNAYAAPKTGGLWSEIIEELAKQLRGDGAKVRRIEGEWGHELAAWINDVVLRFVGIDGPRWMLRAVIVSPVHHGDVASQQLHDVVRDTIVVRGTQPMPVRTPLTIELPPAIAEHIAAQNGA